MPSVLLANEIGLGRGHIANLAQVVTHLGKNFDFYGGLYRLDHADVLEQLGVHVFQAQGMWSLPLDESTDQSPEGNATWGDYLFAMGLAREDLLRNNLLYWTNRILQVNASILVAEYAPISLLAARALRAQGMPLKVITVGTAYSVPPAHLQFFPQLLPDFPYSAREESDVLALINSVLASFGAPPMSRIAELYEVDLAMPMAFSQFDPYRKWRSTEELTLPVTQSPDGFYAGDEVFIYFSYKMDEPEVWDALCELHLPRRAYLPEADEDVKTRLRMSGIIIEPQAVPLKQLASRSRVVVNQAQAGTVQAMSLFGLPQVGLPMHLEHSFHGRRAAQKGVIELLERYQRTRENIVNLIQRTYHSAAMQARARNFAEELAVEAADTSRSMAARLGQFLGQ